MAVDSKFFPAQIENYMALCDLDHNMPDPAGLALALGLRSKSEYDNLKKDPEVQGLLEKAELQMASRWYQLLHLPSKEVNASGVIYALRTMGFQDNFKAQNQDRSTLSLNFIEGDQRL